MRLLLVVALVGCADRPLALPDETDLAAAQPDLAAAADLGVPPDLASGDLASGDLASPDLASGDLAAPPDLARGDRPLELSILAGAPGGSGNADDVGTDARLSVALSTAIADDGATVYYLGSDRFLRRVDVATRRVTTWMDLTTTLGQTTCRPGHLQLDGRGHLLVFDRDFSPCNRIRSVELASGAVTPLAQQPGALNAAHSASDGRGKVYFGQYNHVWSFDTASGALVELPIVDGAGRALPLQLTGMALDGGRLLLASSRNPIILALDLSTGVAGAVDLFVGANWVGPVVRGSPATTDEPRVYGSGRHLYVQYFGELWSLAAMGGGLYSTKHWPLAAPDSDYLVLTEDAAGDLIIGSRQIWRPASDLERIDAATGQLAPLAGLLRGVPVGGAAGEALWAPQGIAATSTGIYVLDATTIYRSSAGQFTSIAGGVPSQPMSDGVGSSAVVARARALIAADADRLYFTDTRSDNQTVLRALRLSTREVTTLFDAPYVDAVGLAMLRDQVLFAFGSLWVIDPASGARRTWLDPASPLDGVAVDGSTVYLTWGHAVARIAPDGTLTRIAGSVEEAGAVDGTADVARFLHPAGLCADGRGHLFLADPDDGTVRRIALSDGAVDTFVGQRGIHGVKPGLLPARLNRPTALAMTPSGELLITDPDENVVLRVGR